MARPLFTQEEEATLLASLARSGAYTPEDVYQVLEWAAAVRLEAQALEAVLQGRVAMMVEHGQVCLCKEEVANDR